MAGQSTTSDPASEAQPYRVLGSLTISRAATTQREIEALPDPVTIGTGRSSGVDTFDSGLIGSIDEPAYYISAWTADEVAAVHAAPDGICR